MIIIMVLSTRIFKQKTITATNAHIQTNSEILAGVQSTIILLINYNISCFSNTGTIDTVYRLYTTACICEISSFNTNATISCMSLPAQLRLLALLLLLFLSF